MQYTKENLHFKDAVSHVEVQRDINQKMKLEQIDRENLKLVERVAKIMIGKNLNNKTAQSRSHKNIVTTMNMPASVTSTYVANSSLNYLNNKYKKS